MTVRQRHSLLSCQRVITTRPPLGKAASCHSWRLSHALGRTPSLPPSLRPPRRLTETFVASQPALTQQACKFNRRSLQSVSTKTSYDAFMSLTESYPCSPPFLTLSHTTVKFRCAANSQRSVLLTNNSRQLA